MTTERIVRAAVMVRRNASLLSASLEPNLNLVAVWIGDVRKWKTRTKLAAAQQPSTRALDFHHRLVDILWIDQSE